MISNLNDLHKLNEGESVAALKALQAKAVANENLFEELMLATKTCTLGQITNALFSVGGKYRRSM